MKQVILGFLALVSISLHSQTLPSITASPINQTVYPGNTATFSVTASGATRYQWLFQGAVIPDATNATLQVANAQNTNCGYYLALAKNFTGWVPSQMAYLFLDYTRNGLYPSAGGVLPCSNSNNIYQAGDIEVPSLILTGTYPDNGAVRMLAGPELDEMRTNLIIPYRPPLLSRSWFSNGYYYAASPTVATIAPGQTVYYGIVVNYTNSGYSISQPSTIMQLVAGTNGTPAQTSYGLKFPTWFATEGVEPSFYPSSPANQLRITGETFNLTNTFWAYTDYGYPTTQWRKNGIPIPNATNNSGIPLPYGGMSSASFTITNAQPSDAGVYDLVIYGNEWVIGPKFYVSIQTTNGQGVFQTPQFVGTNLVCNLVGAPGRNYDVQYSTNLINWFDFTTLSNVTGTASFTNPPNNGSVFYRTVLMP